MRQTRANLRSRREPQLALYSIRVPGKRGVVRFLNALIDGQLLTVCHLCLFSLMSIFLQYSEPSAPVDRIRMPTTPLHLHPLATKCRSTQETPPAQLVLDQGAQPGTLVAHLATATNLLRPNQSTLPQCVFSSLVFNLMSHSDFQ